MAYSVSRTCFRLMRDWKLENLPNGKEISVVPFRTEKDRKEDYRGDSLQFSNGFSGKLLFYLIFNRNFRILLLNGKHPMLCSWARRFTLTMPPQMGTGEFNAEVTLRCTIQGE